MLTTAPHLQVRRPSPTTAEFTVTTCPPMTITLWLALASISLARLALAVGTLLLVYGKWALSPLPFPLGGCQGGRLGGYYDTAAAAITTSTSTSTSTNTYSFVPLAAAAIADNGSAIGMNNPMSTSGGGGSGSDSSSGGGRCYLLAADFARLLADYSPAAAQALAAAARVIPWPALLPCAALTLWLAVRRIHTTESLLVLRGLGIQTSSSGSTILSGGSLLPFCGGGGGFFSLFGLFGPGGGGAAASSGGTTRFIPTEKIRDVLINEAFRGFHVRYYLVVVAEGEEDMVVVFPRLLPRRRIVETVWRGVRGCLYEPPPAAAAAVDGGGGLGAAGRRTADGKG